MVASDHSGVPALCPAYQHHACFGVRNGQSSTRSPSLRLPESQKCLPFGEGDPLMGGWQVRGVQWRHHDVIDMGTLDGGYNSLARAVYSAGEIVGLSTTTIPDPNAMILSFGLPYRFQTRAFRWKMERIHDLGTLARTLAPR